MPEHYLKSLFDPQSIVLVGASTRRDTLGKLMFDQLSPDFKGDLYLVNPHHQNIDGVKCHKKIKNLPEGIDLAIVVTPLKTVVEVFRNCADKGIKNILLMTDLQHKKPTKIVRIKKTIIKIAKEHNIRILGPSAAALIRTTSQLNASFSTNQIHPGKLALVTRSKTLCNTILDWADKHEIGFSSVISHVEELDLCLSDILEFLINDFRTSSIVLHLDEIQHSRRFMSALRAAAIRKPVVLLKSSHDAGCYSDAIAKTSDVRSMDDVFHAAVTRAGADRVYTLSGLFSAAKILASNQRTQGTRLGIISNGEGPIMLANDRLSFFRIEFVKLSSELLSELKQDLEIDQIKNNAVLIADSKNTADGFSAAAKIMLKSGEIDALAILFAPDPFTNPVTVAEAITEAVKGTRKPVLATWMGDSSIDQGRNLLTHNNISNYRTPEAAIDAFSFLCSHLHNRNLLLQIPYPLNKSIEPDIKSAKSIIQRNLKQKRNVLSQVDSRLLLESFHIPCNQSLGATTLDEALAIANDFGYPVVLKIDSLNITYKSDVNGVILNIRNATTLKKQYRKMLKDASELRPNAVIDGVIVERMYAPRNGRELMIRIINDPAFGPVISFGAGGTRLPALHDRSIQLPPLNRRLAENLINKSQVSLLLNNYRNLPAANRTQLQDVLIRVSEIATELPQVFELTINPLILDENQAMVNDSQVVIQNYDSKKKNYEHLAIHPYPSDWHRNIRIKNDISVNLRPIRAEDALAEVEFIKSMSKESKFFRFMHAVNDLTPEMLSRFTKLDYDREMAFAAFTWENDKEIILGVSRYSINPDKQSCEFAIAIADDWQGMGLARQLMLILIEHVKDRDIKVIEGTVLKNNTSMDKLMKSLGFSKSPSPDDYDINIYRCEIPKSSYAYL